MQTLRGLYHLARADFLERTRRYSFLSMLGLVLWLGYLSASGQFRMRVPPDYLGVVNSAWVGATMTVTVAFLLGWVGFYLVKGSVSRDYETGVGQIMATTPLSRPLYTLGKWLSNFAVLGIMILCLLIVGIIMNLRAGTAGFDLWALAAPLVFIALPWMALIAALAVLFETISWLRGGLGNVVYFFAFLFALVTTAETLSAGGSNRAYNPYLDFTGWQMIGASVARAAQAAYPESQGGFAFSITYLADPKIFAWEGLQWTTHVLLSRLFYLLVAVGIGLLAAVCFDRFNPARPMPTKKKPEAGTAAGAAAAAPAAVTAALPVANVRLTPLSSALTRFRFGALFMAELKLLLKGQRWWWYAIALGLLVAQVSSGLEVTHTLLVVSWLWPILILGEIGCRAARYDTRQIVFSAPRPLLNQLPAAWLSACTLTALLGSGAFLRFLLAGEVNRLPAWLTGVVFIPALALALGVLTGSSKTFEALYVLWLYLITQKVTALDFLGMTPTSPWYLYAPLALALLGLAAIARQRQLKGKGFDRH